MKINTKSKKILYFAGIILPIIIILILGRPLENKIVRNTETIPLINTIEEIKKSNISSSSTKEIYNNLAQNQKIIFNWNNSNEILPQSVKKYTLKKTIINSLDINKLLSQFNFYEVDKQEVLLDQSLTWFNYRGSLLISPSRNHLSYYYRTPLPQEKITTSRENLLKITSEILSSILGENIVKTLDLSPKMTYLYKDEKQGEEGPLVVNQSESNLVSLSYKQRIDNYPVITTSKDTDIVTVAIDSKEKLYTLYINGGYSEVLTEGEVSIPSMEKIRNTNTSNFFLINNLDSLDMDKWYRDRKQITVDVTSVTIGYYTGNEYRIDPVIIVEGSIKNPINSIQKVTYVLSIGEIQP